MPRAQRIGFVLVMSLSIGMLPRFAHPVSAQVASIEAPHIGEGGLPQFQVDSNFPKLPSKWRMGFGSAVAIDDQLEPFPRVIKRGDAGLQRGDLRA